MIEQVDFETALSYLKKQATIKRVGWTVRLTKSEGGHIYVISETGEYTIWQPLDRDLLATDWIVAKGD